MNTAKVVLDTGERITITGVHPAADLLPMLDKEGLADLAASIGERGLEHPIVLVADDVLDGRNRLAAGQLAGIEVTATRYDGDDPWGYVLAVNLNRRDMTKGQKAMVAAQVCSETEQTIRTVAMTSGTSVTRIGVASTVLTYATDLAAAVVSGARSLDDAYAEARRRKAAGESEAARMTKLTDAAPDLAGLVIAESITLTEAEARLTTRDKEHKDGVRREVGRVGAFLTGWDCASTMRTNQWRDEILAGLDDYDRGRFLTIEKGLK